MLIYFEKRQARSKIKAKFRTFCPPLKIRVELDDISEWKIRLRVRAKCWRRLTFDVRGLSAAAESQDPVNRGKFVSRS